MPFDIEIGHGNVDKSLKISAHIQKCLKNLLCVEDPEKDCYTLTSLFAHPCFENKRNFDVKKTDKK